MKKRNKKHIESFKNWLIARDSASRINNVKSNSTFFENSFSKYTDKEIRINNK
jgi:hypothetical protein